MASGEGYSCSSSRRILRGGFVASGEGYSCSSSRRILRGGLCG